MQRKHFNLGFAFIQVALGFLLVGIGIHRSYSSLGKFDHLSTTYFMDVTIYIVFVLLGIWLVYRGKTYVAKRQQGLTDQMLYPLQYNQDKIELTDTVLRFTGRHCYPNIDRDLIECLEYQMINDDWQPLVILFKTGDRVTYHLNSEPESLKKMVDLANMKLAPPNPMCQFILSAKPDALTSRD